MTGDLLAKARQEQRESGSSFEEAFRKVTAKQASPASIPDGQADQAEAPTATATVSAAQSKKLQELMALARTIQKGEGCTFLAALSKATKIQKTVADKQSGKQVGLVKADLAGDDQGTL